MKLEAIEGKLLRVEKTVFELGECLNETTDVDVFLLLEIIERRKCCQQCE